MINGFKEKFFNSIIYKFYKTIKENPFVKFFIDYDFFKKIIFSIAFFEILLRKFYRLKIDIKMKNSYIITYIYICAFIHKPVFVFLYSFFLFVLFIFDEKHKEDSFLYLVISILYLAVALIIGNRLYVNLYNIWSSITIFVMLSVYLKEISNEIIKKNIFIIFSVSLIMSYILSMNFFYTLILVFPFFIYYFSHIKKMYFNIAVGSTILSFVINFIKNIIIKIKKYSLNAVVGDVLFYINKGIKGESSIFLENINKTIKNNISGNMAYSERILFFIVVILILLFVILLGKAVFKLVRKAVVQIFSKGTDKSFLLSTLLFFIISSVYLIVVKRGASSKTNYMYWAMLGLIKSKIK